MTQNHPLNSLDAKGESTLQGRNVMKLLHVTDVTGFLVCSANFLIILDNMASNGISVNYERGWKQSSPTLMNYPRICLEKPRTRTHYFSQYIRYLS